jgi:hypothetical protein
MPAAALMAIKRPHHITESSNNKHCTNAPGTIRLTMQEDGDHVIPSR